MQVSRGGGYVERDVAVRGLEIVRREGHRVRTSSRWAKRRLDRCGGMRQGRKDGGREEMHGNTSRAGQAVRLCSLVGMFPAVRYRVARSGAGFPTDARTCLVVTNSLYYRRWADSCVGPWIGSALPVSARKAVLCHLRRSLRFRRQLFVSNKTTTE